MTCIMGDFLVTASPFPFCYLRSVKVFCFGQKLKSVYELRTDVQEGSSMCNFFTYSSSPCRDLIDFCSVPAQPLKVELTTLSQPSFLIRPSYSLVIS